MLSAYYGIGAVSAGVHTRAKKYKILYQFPGPTLNTWASSGFIVLNEISNKFTIFKETQIRGLFFNYIRNMSDANFSTPVPIIVDLFNVDDTSVAKKWCGTFFEANWMDASKYLAL